MGDPPFWHALGETYTVAGPCVAAEIRETERYWIFPVREIGKLGALVDRRNGHAELMGLVVSEEVWIWAYERGLMKENADLLIESCHNLSRAIFHLQLAFRISSYDLEKLPLRLYSTWHAIEPLWMAGDAISWRVIDR